MLNICAGKTRLIKNFLKKMIKNAIKAVTLYTISGLTIRRPTISKKRHLLVFLVYTPLFSFQRQTEANVRPLPHDRRSYDANAPLTHNIPVLRSAIRLPYSADHLYNAGGYLYNAGGYLHAAADHLWRHVSDETKARAIRNGSARHTKRKHVTAVTRQQMQSTSPQVGLQTGLRLSLSE